RVFELVQADPSLLAAIAAGELPEAFLAKLQREGISLIPRKWNEMSRSCSCPDYGDPCKHMAALYYIIAREVDADPCLLFRLRGVDLKDIGGRYGARLSAGPLKELPAPFTVEAAPDERRLSDRAAPPDFPEIPHCASLILSLLPPKPAFSEGDFAVTLAAFYHDAARFVPWQSGDTGGDAEAMEHSFSRSRWSLECPNPGPGSQPVLLRKTLSGETERWGVYDAFLCFRDFSSEDGTENYRFLYYLFKFLNLLCAAGAFIPFPIMDNGRLRVIWQPYRALPLISETLNTLAEYEDRMLFLGEAGGKAKKPRYASSRSVADLLSSALLNERVQRTWLSGASARLGQDALGELFFRGGAIDVSSPARRSLPAGIAHWLAVLHLDFRAWKYRFTLKAAGKFAPREDESADFSVPGFNLSMEVLLEDENGVTAVALKDAAKKTGAIDVLKAPTALANYLPEIRALTTRKTVELSPNRLTDFLDEAADLLARLGIEVIFPKSLRRELKPRLVISAQTKNAGSLVNYLSLNSLLDWKWQIAIGDTVLNPQEFAALLKQKKGLVRFRNQFIRLDPEELARLLKNAESQPAGVNDFLRAHFSGDSVLSFDAEAIIQRLLSERPFPVPQGLNASLREYQERGCRWVCSLLTAGFGCILADDMGLGKTVQAISALLRLREDGLLADGCLVAAPAALLENWERELGRFAPGLTVSRYHGSKRSLDAAAEVFLTTYQTAVRDAEKLRERAFSLLIADEAHLMKNAETRGARTMKGLRSQFRLALSGTPVENRLEDMRSLFDFILPGYLGTQAQFKEAWRVPIEALRRKDKAEALRKITAPFLLRRLKTDKAVIADLPDKVSINEYAALEKGQAALYQSIVADTMEKMEKMEKADKTEEPGRRRALILSLLTSLKQVCDHPRIYDKESPARSDLSGKAMLLLTLLRGILAGREKALVFSQYVEALECLETIIRDELGEEVLLYHGGMGTKQRSAAVDRFQTDPACPLLLVSLRAGGLGLNLTAASRVIHYDLWYNPAVENQATDRAFRIGQTRNVFVHRLITKNSFEEKIDAMLQSKRELADLTVAS
ncbi:MAG: DEAD/DEAH box helicase, partial [Treponema sp.]|nr:DEAD/DEAH box helicase [Treponema sp.]